MSKIWLESLLLCLLCSIAAQEYTQCATEPLYENTTLCRKPEIHDISQRLPTRTEPGPNAACTKNLVKFGYVVLELYKRTDRQTNRQVNRQTHYNTSHPYGSTAHHVYSSAAMEHDKHIVCQLYSITAYGGCLHSLWGDLALCLSPCKSHYI